MLTLGAETSECCLDYSEGIRLGALTRGYHKFPLYMGIFRKNDTQEGEMIGYLGVTLERNGINA